MLFFLLSLLVHAHSRRKMLIIGGIFVLFSGLLYFLFMAAWLNLFLLFGRMSTITLAAGIIALIIGVLNIKDFFFFRAGVSLVIPDRAKDRLFERMRVIMHAGSLPAMIAATMVLALAANSYEIICTAGFPMIYTRTLTLHSLPIPVYYSFIALYNLVYVIPLAAIVTIFVITLGSRKLSEWQGRLLKLLSGTMMFALGLIILIWPALLTNVFVSLGLLVFAVTVTALAAVVGRRLGLDSR